jgi:ribosomal protein L37AE/L43A
VSDPAKLISAQDLVDKLVACPRCGADAFVRRDADGLWLDCPGHHRPLMILPETSLKMIEKAQAKL